MRPIDADAFEADCRKRYCAGCDNYNGIKCKACWVADMLDEIENAPTVSPDEVRGVGKWNRVETEFGLRCPKCGKLLDDYVNGGEWVALSEIPNYCPNCGARLTGGEND